MGRTPTPALNLYQGGGAPSANAIRPAVGANMMAGDNMIAESLSRLGTSVVQAGQANIEAQRVQRQREEDDARVYVARTMPEIRRRANQMSRDAFENAPDGWRGATDTIGANYSEITAGALEAAPTEAARLFMERSLAAYGPDLLDNAAAAEQEARRGWREDGFNSAIDASSSVLAADPNQYEAVRNELLEPIRTSADLSANQRRDLEAKAEEQLAVAAVSGLVERDPRSALTLLRDADAEGAVARLSGAQRNALENRAQAELNRRASEARAAQSEARASLRDTLSAQTQLLQQGIVPQQPLDPETVGRVLGPDVAQAYIANLASASYALDMAAMPSSQVAQVAAGSVTGEGSDMGRLLTNQAREAAQRVLTARQQDPAGYALQNGQMRHAELIPMLQAVTSAPPGAANWPAVDAMLRDRGADAVELRRSGITSSVSVLSSNEASALSAWLGQQSTQNRLAFFSRAQANMNPEAYNAMMGQLSPDGAGAVTAYAGYVYGQRTGRPTANGPAVARTLLQGQEALSGNTQGQDRRQTLNMPQEDDLRRTFAARVGNAYEGHPQAFEQSYQAFRAYYAGLTEQAGDASGALVEDRANRAIAVATGGTTEWSGRTTTLPWGMSEQEFRAGVRRGFQQYSFLQDEDPSEYELRPVGAGRYQVFVGDDPLRNPINRRSVVIEVRR